MNADVRAFRRRRLGPVEGGQAACRVLTVPSSDWASRARELSLDDPETLLPLFEALRRQWESDPAGVHEKTSALYSLLEKLEPQYPIDAFLLDEREYFLGEAARIIGTVSRDLGRRDEARRWLDRAEMWFLLTENAAANISKVQYQRLALKVEERDFDPVLEQLPQLTASFRKLGMQDDLLKTRFLEANALREKGFVPEALSVFEDIALEAQSLRNETLLAHAYVNISQIHGFSGRSEEAIERAQAATVLLKKLGNRIGLAKLQWGIGYLLRGQHKLSAAIEAYRAAQQEFAEIEMHADVAAVHLVVADLLLDAGQEKQAEWEIRQALPLIEEYKLVPEGFAAMSLLRESLRRQKIDRSALRNLHGYFEEIGS